MDARLACLPWTIRLHHCGMGRASFAFAQNVRLCCFPHFRGSSLSRPLRLAPELLDLLRCPQKSLDHACERSPLFGRELAPADRRNYRGNSDRHVRSLLERRQIDLDGRAFALGKDHPHQAAERSGIAPFRLLDEMVRERLAVALDELLQEDGCPVACATRTAGRIAALTWLEGVSIRCRPREQRVVWLADSPFLRRPFLRRRG